MTKSTPLLNRGGGEFQCLTIPEEIEALKQENVELKAKLNVIGTVYTDIHGQNSADEIPLTNVYKVVARLTLDPGTYVIVARSEITGSTSTDISIIKVKNAWIRFYDYKGGGGCLCDILTLDTRTTVNMEMMTYLKNTNARWVYFQAIRIK